MKRRALTALTFVVLAGLSEAQSAETMRLVLAQDQIVALPADVATVVIGNPLIVDVTVVPQKRAVLTPKSYGMTNMILLDRGGAILDERSIEVRAPENLLVLHCAAPRQTFVCGPKCEPRNLLGDVSCSGAPFGPSGAPASKQGASGAQTRGSSAEGPCDTPDDIASDGSRCGGRAASERPGGRP